MWPATYSVAADPDIVLAVSAKKRKVSVVSGISSSRSGRPRLANVQAELRQLPAVGLQDVGHPQKQEARSAGGQREGFERFRGRSGRPRRPVPDRPGDLGDLFARRGIENRQSSPLPSTSSPIRSRLHQKFTSAGAFEAEALALRPG